MRYSWTHPASTIREVEFKPVGKRTEALIYAPAGTEDGAFSAITEALRQAGLPAVIPDTAGDRQVLRVENADKAAVLHVLEYSGMVKGAPSVEQTEADHKPHEGFASQFKIGSVRSAGYAYLLGDALMILAGLVRMKGLEGEARKGGVSELATGAMWFAPNVALVAFGKKNPEMQTEALMRRVKEHLDRQGVEIPSEDKFTLEHLSRKDGPLSRIVEFFYEHPTEINNAMEAAGGALMVKGGYEQKLGLPEKSQPNPFKMAAGAIMGSGMAASVVLKEEKDQEKQKEMGPVARFFSKPLRVAGTGAFINNILNIIGAGVWEGPKVKKFLGEDYQPEKERLEGIMNATEGTNWQAKAEASRNLEALETQKIIAGNYGTAAKLNLGTAASFMLANGLYALSSKDTGADIKAMGGLDQVYAVTAHVIAAQPKEHQMELVNRMAGFLASQSDVKDSAADIARLLEGKVRGLSHSPWTQRVQAAAAPDAAQPTL